MKELFGNEDDSRGFYGHENDYFSSFLLSEKSGSYFFRCLKKA